MGILNVTPDSFSDGGSYLEVDRAVERAYQLVAEGADIVDIGGESTRPGAPEVGELEELQRVIPVLERLAGQLPVPVSIDTRKPIVAELALQAGVAVVNDVSAHRRDPLIWESVARFRAGYVAMHMQGTPETMQDNPNYQDVVSEVTAFFGDCITRLVNSGVDSEQVVLDPGIGFGKSLAHNLELLAHLNRLPVKGRPLLLGISRKSFLGQISGTDVSSRVPGGLACTAWARIQGVQIFRTHDVAVTVQALRTLEAINPVKSF